MLLGKYLYNIIGCDDMLNNISDAEAVQFGNNPIKRVHKSKLLGIIIDISSAI